MPRRRLALVVLLLVAAAVIGARLALVDIYRTVRPSRRAGQVARVDSEGAAAAAAVGHDAPQDVQDESALYAARRQAAEDKLAIVEAEGGGGSGGGGGDGEQGGDGGGIGGDGGGDDQGPAAAAAVPARSIVAAAAADRTPGPWPARRAQVVDAIQHAWQGYRQFAWGHDELAPLSRTGTEWFNLGLTIVDSLDTLWLAGLSAEFAEARAWVTSSLNLNIDSTVNLFEVTIRVLGGLLSAYYLTQDAVFLDRATDLGDRLMGGFTQSHTPIPFASVNLRSRAGVRAHFAGGASSTSEVTTLQLEFAYLSALTGDDRFRRAADAVIAHIDGLNKQSGLVPVFIRHVPPKKTQQNEERGENAMERETAKARKTRKDESAKNAKRRKARKTRNAWLMVLALPRLASNPTPAFTPNPASPQTPSSPSPLTPPPP